MVESTSQRKIIEKRHEENWDQEEDRKNYADKRNIAKIGVKEVKKKLKKIAEDLNDIRNQNNRKL